MRRIASNFYDFKKLFLLYYLDADRLIYGTKENPALNQHVVEHGTLAVVPLAS